MRPLAKNRVWKIKILTVSGLAACRFLLVRVQFSLNRIHGLVSRNRRPLLVTEKERVEGKLERLLERNDVVLKEIMKSKATKLQKVEIYEAFYTFVGGLCCHLEEKYLTSKKK